MFPKILKRRSKNHPLGFMVGVVEEQGRHLPWQVLN